MAQAKRAVEQQQASPASNIGLDSGTRPSQSNVESQTTASVPASEPAATTEPSSGLTEGHSVDVHIEHGLDSQLCPTSFASSECVICWEADASVVLQPCGHMCACPGCAAMLQHSDCPMCRCRVQSCLNVQ